MHFVPMQLRHSLSSVKGTAELLVGETALTFEGELTNTKSGFKQVMVFNHSIPQVTCNIKVIILKFKCVKCTFKNCKLCGSMVLTHQH